MRQRRNGTDGRLSSRAGRLAAVLALVLMPVVAGRLEAQWVPFSPPDSVPNRDCHAAAYDPLNDKIYMIGGTSNGYADSIANLCQRYDPAADTWSLMTPIPTPRCWMSAAYVRGNVYVAGGISTTSAASAANEEYTITANSWTSRRPLPVAELAFMTGVWRDSLIYIIGGMDGSYSPIMTPQVYNPFTNSWADGTPLPKAGDMGSAVIVGDTIYISNAYDRPNGLCWRRMLKGAINPDTATQITWLWGPLLPEHLQGCPGGTVSLHNKVYTFGYFVDTLPDTTATMTGLVYDPAIGAYVDSLPSLLLEGVWGLSGDFVVAREAADEIYQIAGTRPSGGCISHYNKLSAVPDGTREAGPAVMPTSRLRVPALFRNGVQIHYEIGRPCRATLTVYDQSGRMVRTLASGPAQAGSYTTAWDGRDQYGRPAGSGVYFCRLRAGEFTTARKMVKTE